MSVAYLKYIFIQNYVKHNQEWLLMCMKRGYFILDAFNNMTISMSLSLL